jgi:hypothetical protein
MTPGTFTVDNGLHLIAGALILASVTFAVWISPWFLVVTAFVGANLLQSAFSNWCPMMTILRKAGFRD